MTDEQILIAVREALQAISAPYLQAAVGESIKQSGHLIVDIDLTGRPVSPTSVDYPEADFGSLCVDDGVSKGYQAAISALVCERWGRLLLTLQRYGGRTLSADCLQAAVQEVEALLQVRPRRRVELVQARRQELAELEADYQAKGWWERPHSHLAKTWRQLVAAHQRQERAWRKLQKL